MILDLGVLVFNNNLMKFLQTPGVIEVCNNRYRTVVI